MSNQKHKCICISDFNIQNLTGHLQSSSDLPVIDVHIASYGQVIPTLMQEDKEHWQHDNIALIWTQPGGVIASFNDIIQYKQMSIKKILEEVDEYSSLILRLSKKVKSIFIPTWVTPPYYKGMGMLDLKSDFGIAYTLMRMNLKLIENLKKAPNIYILDTQRWVNIVGEHAFNPKLWYMGKVAFGNEVFKVAAKEIKSAIRGIQGKARKLIVLDLDDTLWGGIVGDVGWENIRLGGHDYYGEAFVDFQHSLKSLTNRGILLGIVSKNEEETALGAINKHPEMVLKLKDFAGWKINWQDKAQNIIDLVSELNIGLQSVVFIDDNPVERARVREALPEVFVPEWPKDKMLYKSALLNLHCFDAPLVSKEDSERTKMYVAERDRENLKNTVGSIDEWLKTIKICVAVEPLSNATIQRTSQLLNKTNQMNLTTRRMTESELIAWTKQKNHRLWTFHVTDKFGDSGLTGIISLKNDNNVGEIIDFILSCRVMGRKVEETMLYTIIEFAKTLDLNEIKAKYIPTVKNKPCLEFFKNSGFEYNEKDNCFTWKINKNYFIPECIKIVNNLDKVKISDNGGSKCLN